MAEIRESLSGGGHGGISLKSATGPLNRGLTSEADHPRPGRKGESETSRGGSLTTYAPRVEKAKKKTEHHKPEINLLMTRVYDLRSHSRICGSGRRFKGNRHPPSPVDFDHARTPRATLLMQIQRIPELLADVIVCRGQRPLQHGLTHRRY